MSASPDAPQLPQWGLKGRTVLITGASSGIGDRFARLCASAGAQLVLAARRTDRLEALRDELEAAGTKAIAVAMDVAEEASVISAFDRAEAHFGGVDSVFANAGMSEAGSALELAVEDFDRQMAVNLRGVFLTAREAARRMIAAGSEARQHGRIVITASIAGSIVAPGLSAYCASKAGVLHMGRVLAKEWARKGISVNMISPGYIRTEINSDWFDTDMGKQRIQSFNRRRLMEIEGLDASILFLLGDGARHVSGANFTLDDGQSL